MDLLIVFRAALLILIVVLIRAWRREKKRGRTVDFLLVARELKQAKDAGTADQRQLDLLHHLEHRLARVGSPSSAESIEDIWRKQLTEAWDRVLARLKPYPLPLPPWRVKPRIVADIKAPAPPLAAADTPPPLPEAPPKPEQQEADFFEQPEFSQLSDIEFEIPLPPPPPMPPTVETPSAEPQLTSRSTDEATRFAWRPAALTSVELTIQKLSGWPKLFIPFIKQNIGWFIGGFFFISGSMFLVAQSTGFMKYLMISASLLCYTLLLLGGAVRMLKKRPELYGIGSVLVFIAMLLAPLCIAASIRLISIGAPQGIKIAAGGLWTIINLGLLYWGARLASGMTHRSLQIPHARLLIGLCAVQAGVPLISGNIHWLAPCFFQTLVLALLAYNVIGFAKTLLTAVFVDQQKIGIYAAGTLIFAAAVSFLHISWAYGGTFPAGYFGPFVMAFAGLIFYIDASLKEWVKQYAWLSRFTFLIYGCSALALVLAYPGAAALLLTLSLGICVYGLVVWRYLTVAPLYCLIGCLAWIYWLVAWQYLRVEVWFLAGIPLTAGLLTINRRVLKVKAEKLARVMFRVLALMVLGLASLSLALGRPGGIGLATAVSLTLMLYVMCRPAAFESSLGRIPAFYLIPAGAALALAYMPRWLALSWSEQFIFSLTAMSGLLTASGWKLFYSRYRELKTLIGGLMNSALVMLGLALVMTFSFMRPLFEAQLLIPVFALAGIICVCHGLFFRLSSLIFCAMALLAAAGGMFKRMYVPGPSVGIAETILAFPVLWGLIRIDRQEQFMQTVLQTYENSFKPPLFGGILGQKTLSRLLIPPLRTALLLLLAWSIFRLTVFISHYPPSWGWLANVFLTGIALALTLIHLRLFWLWPAPILAGLIGMIGLIYRLCGLDLTLIYGAMALYALVIWAGGLKSARVAAFQRLFTAITLGKEAAFPAVLMQTTHWTAFGISAAALLGALSYWIVNVDLSALPAIALSLTFLLWAAAHKHTIHLFFSFSALTVAMLRWEFFLLHPDAEFNLGLSAPPDQWLMLALTALAASVSGYGFMKLAAKGRRAAGFFQRCVSPAYVIAWGLFLWATCGALWSATNFPDTDSSLYFSWTMLTLGLIQFPLLQAYTSAFHSRGPGLALFLTLAGVSAMWAADIGQFLNLGLIAWGYGLWLTASFIIPQFNRRFPSWSFEAWSWPWFGFVAVVIGVGSGCHPWPGAASYQPDVLLGQAPGEVLLIGAGYALLMLRYSNWLGFSILAVVSLDAGLFSLIHQAQLRFGIEDRYLPWLNLSLICLGQGIAAGIMLNRQAKKSSEAPARRIQTMTGLGGTAYWMAAGLFMWSLFGLMYACAVYGFESLNGYAAVILASLTFALTALIQPQGVLLRIRTAGVMLFLCAAYSIVWHLLGLNLKHFSVYPVYAGCWWLIAASALPQFNQRLPYLALCPQITALSGLIILLTLPPLMADGVETVFSTLYLGVVAGYLFLLLRFFHWNGIAWAATVALTGAVMIAIFQATHPQADLAFFSWGGLLWANLMLVFSGLARRLGFNNPQSLGIKQVNLIRPFVFCAGFVLCGIALLGSMAELLTRFKVIYASVSPWLLFPLTSLSFLHLYIRRPNRFTAHGLIFSVFLMAAFLPRGISLPLALALWSLLIFAGDRLSGRLPAKFHEIWRPLTAPLNSWLFGSLWLTLILLTLVKIGSVAELLASLVILTVIFAEIGRTRQRTGLLWLSRGLFLVILHTWPAGFLPAGQAAERTLFQIGLLLAEQFQRLKLLFPWYALQLAAMSWGLGKVYAIVSAPVAQAPEFRRRFNAVWIETGLAILALSLHLFVNVFIAERTLGGQFQIHDLAALAAFILIIIRLIGETYLLKKSGLVYLSAVIMGLAAIYLRILALGHTAVGLWDTGVLLGSGYLLFMLYRFTETESIARPLFRLMIFIPLLALLTTPLAWASSYTAATLLALGALYLSIRYATGSSVALGLGVLALNAAIYLWIPLWAEKSSLIQLYIVPAAISVLVLLHLHAEELNRNVLNSSRLAAISVLYTCATLDFFLQQNPLIFSLALALSLLGTALGFIFRIRAFLYGGLVFMLVNVIGQMILFYLYRRDTIWEGIILVGLGALIIAAMIWFNIRREDILKRVRLFRSDLETWD